MRSRLISRTSLGAITIRGDVYVKRNKRDPTSPRHRWFDNRGANKADPAVSVPQAIGSLRQNIVGSTGGKEKVGTQGAELAIRSRKK